MTSAPLRGPFALFRGALLLVCALLSVVQPRHLSALPVLVGLAGATVIVFFEPRLERHFPYTGAVVVAAFVPLTGAAHSPLYPYLLAPGLTLGFTRGARALLLAGASVAAVLLLAPLLPQVGGSSDDYVVTSIEWVLLMLGLGLMAGWADRLTSHSEPPDVYGEVRRLLQQVQALTRQLPGGLDAPGVAQGLVDRCCAGIPESRGAFLAYDAPSFVPIAVQGTRRVPWRAPLEHEGPLRTAWLTQELVVDVRQPGGRRRASSLLALPVASAAEPFGLLVIESRDLDGMSPERVARVRAEVAATASQLEAALLFEEVRLAASLEERDRLAREMHDGIAQDLAFVGYRLDDLRGRAAKVSPELGDLAQEVRSDLSRLISELRLSITELRSSVRPDRGIGTVLASYLQAVTSGRDIRLTISLQETAFRLPSEAEVALLQAAQAFAQEARRSPGVTELSLELAVDPPSARLLLTCDGEPFELPTRQFGQTLAKVGGVVSASDGRTRGSSLEMVLGGQDEEDDRPPGGRPRAHPPGTTSSVRAD